MIFSVSDFALGKIGEKIMDAIAMKYLSNRGLDKYEICRKAAYEMYDWISSEIQRT